MYKALVKVTTNKPTLTLLVGRQEGHLACKNNSDQLISIIFGI